MDQNMDVPRKKGKLKCLWFLNIAFNQTLRNQIVCAKKGSPQIYAISHFCSGCKNGGWRNCILQLVESIRPWSFRMYRIWLLDLLSSVFFVNSYFWRIFTQIQTVWICWTLKICADVVRIPFSRDPLLALVSSKSVVVLVHWFHRQNYHISNWI